MFLRNAWYVAAWGREISRELTTATILGDDIVMYRRGNGSPVALEDACPHRKLPLSMGRLTGDCVECGYHGLTWDGTGIGVASPTQPGQIPKRAAVRSYPLVERYRLVWIWMGDPSLADPAEIFPIENFNSPDWGLTDGGVMPLNCHYLWMADNLLDPSHVAWVHRTSFAGGGTDNVPLSVEKHDTGVTVSRWISGEAPSPYYADLVKFRGPCDRLQHYEINFPAIGVNKTIFTPEGQGGPEFSPDENTFINISYNFMTPVDDARTRYFWFQHRNTDGQDAEISTRMNDGAYAAFAEDKEILEAVQKGMAEMRTPNLNLTLDAGAQLFRRGLDALIEAEVD